MIAFLLNKVFLFIFLVDSTCESLYLRFWTLII